MKTELKDHAITLPFTLLQHLAPKILATPIGLPPHRTRLRRRDTQLALTLRQRIEGEAMVIGQCEEQPALLKRAAGRVRA